VRTLDDRVLAGDCSNDGTVFIQNFGGSGVGANHTLKTTLFVGGNVINTGLMSITSFRIGDNPSFTTTVAVGGVFTNSGTLFADYATATTNGTVTIGRSGAAKFIFSNEPTGVLQINGARNTLDLTGGTLNNRGLITISPSTT